MKKKNYLVCFDIEKQENLQLLRASDMHFKTKKHAEKIDADCKLNDIAIKLHNRASDNEVSGTTEGNVGELSKPTAGPIEDFQIK